MLRYFGVVLLIASGAARAQELSEPGPHHAGYREVTVARPDGTSFTSVLYYPAVAPGSGASVDPTGGPYPGVSFGHGFFQPVDRYRTTLEHLATWGYIVIAPTSQGGLFPSHSAFAADLRSALAYLTAQDAGPGFLQGLVDTDHYGLSGHSMGGGASILAARDDATVDALANLAAAETNPSAIAAMSGVNIPFALIAGDADGIVPVSSNGRAMYNAGRAPRQLPVIKGGWHCGFEDVSTFGCDSGPLPRTDQLAITRRLLVQFFNLYLKGDQSGWQAVWGPGASADAAVTLTLDAGIGVTPPAQEVQAGPGGAVASFTVTNTGPRPAAYDLLVEGGPASVAPAVTGELAPGGSAMFTVTAGAGGYVVSARSRADGGTRGWVRLSVSGSPCAAIDYNGDGQVDFSDYLEFLNAYDALAAAADLNGDGLVDFSDYLDFLTLYDDCGA